MSALPRLLKSFLYCTPTCILFLVTCGKKGIMYNYILWWLGDIVNLLVIFPIKWKKPTDLAQSHYSDFLVFLEGTLSTSDWTEEASCLIYSSYTSSCWKKHFLKYPKIWCYSAVTLWKSFWLPFILWGKRCSFEIFYTVSFSCQLAIFVSVRLLIKHAEYNMY